MKAALLLLTCDRPDLTQRTVDSLLRHVDLTRFMLLHGDDCSASKKNCDIARMAGFKTVLRTENRSGVGYMWSNLVKLAALQGADWVVMQENDWEWVRPFPFDALEYAHQRDDLYYIRFFGKYRERDNQRPCNPKHMAKGTTPVWSKFNNGWQTGDIHWGFPANATKIDEALFLTKGIKAEGCARKRSAQIKKLVMRPEENYQFHIGDERTPGFIA